MGIYLDHGATSYPKPECVYDAINDFMRNNGTSPGRGSYAKAMQAEQIVYETRKALCKLFGVQKPGSIVFTSNVTDAINTVLKGFLKRGDVVLTSNIEHNAMWRPLKKMENDGMIELHQFHSAPDGSVDLEEIKKLLDGGVRLLAMTHGSNVLGSIMSIYDIVPLAHERNVPVLLDSAQTAGALPINIGELDIDFFAFTGHKGLLGPTGTGGFYIKPGLQLDTLREGGTGSMSRSPFQPDDPPDRYESGTLNIFGLAGLRASSHYLLEKGVAQICMHEQALMAELMNNLSQNSRIVLYGNQNPEKRLGLLCFNIDGIDAFEVARQLDNEYGIMVRAGLHCAPQAHSLLGTQDVGAVRVSVGFSNTMEEMWAFISAINEIAKG